MRGMSHPDYVVDCIDVKCGDTVVVEDTTGSRATVRVYGIESPDNDHPYGSAAAEATRRAAQGKRVEIYVRGTDRHGHVVARVLAGRTRLGRFLVRKGYAWHNRQEAPGAQTLARLQQKARTAGRGLWAQDTPSPPGEDRTHNSPSRAISQRLVRFMKSFVRTALILGPALVLMG